MKNTFLAIFIAFFAITACETPEPSSEADFSTLLDSVSYTLGYYYGDNLSSEGVDEIDSRNFIAGVLRGFEDEEAQLSENEMQMVLQSFQQQLQQNQSMRREAEAAVNIQEGQEFLQTNAEKDEVMVTDSGLQYEVLEEGSGARPNSEDQVEVHYEGTLINGEVFDSSYERGDTVTFPLNRVISGWTEGLQLMTVGSKYKFYIPAELGYGNNPPQGSIIQPGSVLIFEVELIDIVD